eukprot:c25388_g4_i1 orf=413-1879(-)
MALDKWCSLEQQPMNDSSRSNDHYEPSDLRLGCPIFLSHSGSDKDFASFLQQALYRRGYRVFYDKEILPKVVPVSMTNILGKAKNCSKLGLLVLSDDFFEHTRNPMLELAAFVEHKVELLPLFYKLSLEEFKEESRRERWYKKWRAWEPENVVAQWKDALTMIGTINGIEPPKDQASDLKMYVHIIANKVCEILPNDLSHSNEAFQGKQRLCEFVIQMFERVEDLHQTESHMVDKDNSSQLMDTRKYSGRCIQHVVRHNLVAGVHGFEGTGKSSLCKALNDHHSLEFKGRVCHIEMGSDGGPLSRLTNLLSCFDNHLSTTRLHVEEQVWNLLRENIRLSTRPIYMSIDNVAEESINEAEEYLKCGPFPKGSKIFITSRTLEMLQRVTRNDKSCVWEEMPSLHFYEAKDVFLHKMGCAIPQGADSMVNQCVTLCTLNVDNVDFHPLRLISLARYMVAKINISDPLMWKRVVAELISDRRSILQRVKMMV